VVADELQGASDRFDQIGLSDGGGLRHAWILKKAMNAKRVHFCRLIAGAVTYTSGRPTQAIHAFYDRCFRVPVPAGGMDRIFCCRAGVTRRRSRLVVSGVAVLLRLVDA
ncbi:MAG: hypothetical protein ABJB17_11875, partial [Burkholderiales bacterium]